LRGSFDVTEMALAVCPVTSSGAATTEENFKKLLEETLERMKKDSVYTDAGTTSTTASASASVLKASA